MNGPAIIIIILLSLLLGWATSTGVKSQWVRLVDIFLYGPFLIWLGLQQEDVFIQTILLLMGSTTISYNLKNYFAS